MALRDRLLEAFRDRKKVPGKHALADAALSVLAEGIEIVTPHREECGGKWYRASGALVFRCTEGEGPTWCPAEARIPEALLVELVEAGGPGGE